MTLIAIGILTLIASYLISYWRYLEQRQVRWQMYALRDQLRTAAIQDPKFRESDLFWRLDRSLSDFCEHASEFSLWLLIPAAMRSTPTRSESVSAWAEVDGSDFTVAKEVVGRASSLLIKSVMLKHLLLLVVLALTIVGIVPIIIAYDRLVGLMQETLLMTGLQKRRLGDAAHAIA